MAHHRNTPQSVLDAPTRTVEAVFVPAGATRRDRRHGVVIPAGLGVQQAALYLARLGRNRNATAVRSTSRRGRKVRRAARVS